MRYKKPAVAVTHSVGKTSHGDAHDREDQGPPENVESDVIVGLVGGLVHLLAVVSRVFDERVVLC